MSETHPTSPIVFWQEVARLGGHYVHVLDESVDSKHEDATGEAWLHRRFTCVLYRDPAKPA